MHLNLLDTLEFSVILVLYRFIAFCRTSNWTLSLKSFWKKRKKSDLKRKSIIIFIIIECFSANVLNKEVVYAWFKSYTTNSLVLWLSFIWFLKLYGAAQSSHGCSNLRKKRQRLLDNRNIAVNARRGIKKSVTYIIKGFVFANILPF